MPFHAVSTFGNVRVALWRSDETSETLLSQAAPARRTEYEAAIAGMAEHRRCERLAVRLLLERLGIDAAIEYLPSGKPVLRGDSRCISISHTKGWAAAAVADPPVGIDIERWSDRASRVVRRFLNEKELPLLQSCDPDRAATLLWSAKESLFKLLDAPAVDFARHLCIEPFRFLPESGSGTFAARERRTPQQRECCVTYAAYPDFVLTLAAFS